MEELNELRYRLYLQRAVLDAHLTFVNETLSQVEERTLNHHLTIDDFIKNNEEMFAQYISMITERRKNN